MYSTVKYSTIAVQYRLTIAVQYSTAAQVNSTIQYGNIVHVISTVQEYKTTELYSTCDLSDKKWKLLAVWFRRRRGR